jgi:hypothetical protein
MADVERTELRCGPCPCGKGLIVVEREERSHTYDFDRRHNSVFKGYRQLQRGDECSMKQARVLGPKPPSPTEVFSLHRYFINANFMRHCFFEKLKAEGVPADLTSESRIYMDFWYAGLYVVIEGWMELKLTDPAIDKLLSSPNVELLKRYRHGVCHFQKKYFDPRFMNLIHDKSVVAWLQVLNREFGRFFMEYLRTHDKAELTPPELKDEDGSKS